MPHRPLPPCGGGTGRRVSRDIRIFTSGRRSITLEHCSLRAKLKSDSQMFDEAPKEAVRAIAYAGVSPAWAGPAGFLLRPDGARLGRSGPAPAAPWQLTRRSSTVSAFLSNELIVMVARGLPARPSSMNPRTRYWIAHWLDALTWPASLVLKGIRTTAANCPPRD
jgi:hypothetical protein